MSYRGWQDPYGWWSSYGWGYGHRYRAAIFTSALIPLLILFGGHARRLSTGLLRLVVAAGGVTMLACLAVAVRRGASRRTGRVALSAGIALLALVLLLLRDRLHGIPWRESVASRADRQGDSPRPATARRTRALQRDSWRIRGVQMQTKPARCPW